MQIIKTENASNENDSDKYPLNFKDDDFKDQFLRKLNQSKLIYHKQN